MLKIAKRPHGPVDILKTTLSIIRRKNAERVAIRLVPRGWNVLHNQIAAEAGPFDLEPNDDVQVVRQFVGLNANQRRADRVDRPMKLIQRNASQCIRERALQATPVMLQNARLRPTMFSHNRDCDS